MNRTGFFGFSAVILLVIPLGACGSGEPPTGLLADLEGANAVAWIAPHPDDEIFASGVLGQASLGYRLESYVVSGNREATETYPGTPADRLVDNQEFKEYLQLADYIYAAETLPGFPGDSLEEKFAAFVDDFVAGSGVDLIITFENTQGLNGHPDHKQMSDWLTEYAASSPVGLYYLVNRDPLLNRIEPDHDLDPLPVTDTLDLTREVTGDGGPITLWDLKLGVLDIYKSSQPGAYYYMVENPEALEQMMKEECYRKVY